MNIIVYYSSGTLEGRLAAYLVHLKYYSLIDSANHPNNIKMVDCNGVAYATIKSDLAAETAGYYHRAFNFLPSGTSAGEMTTVDITALKATLLNNSAIVDVLGDSNVVTVVPYEFPTLLVNRNSVQMVWNGLFCFKSNPYTRGIATSATSNSLTDTTQAWTVSDLVGKYVHIISGTGVGEGSYVITSNTANSVSIGATTFETTPDATSQYYITNYQAKIRPLWINYLGGKGGQVDFGTATVSGSSSTVLSDTNKSWTAHQFLGLKYYAYIYKGTGIGSYGLVTDNTTSALDIPTGLLTTPDATSQWVLISNPNQVFWMMYIRLFQWLYASNISKNDQLTTLGNMYDQVGNMWQEDPQVDPHPNFALMMSDIIPKGKAAFDIMVTALP